MRRIGFRGFEGLGFRVWGWGVRGLGVLGVRGLGVWGLRG